MKAAKPLYYGAYLKTQELLGLQQTESEKLGVDAHDEMLFIVIHQAYELWFKQILHDLGSVLGIFSTSSVEDSRLGTCVSRLERINEIQKLLIKQVDVLERMTPMDFLDFRDLLVPASGFQSVQFRKIENLMGLKREARINFGAQNYLARLSPEDRASLEESEKVMPLFNRIEAWLERTPFLDWQGFSFWQAYGKAVDSMLEKDRALILGAAGTDEAFRKQQLDMLERTKGSFSLVLDAGKHDELAAQGAWRLSFKATQAALFIFLYRDYPALQAPYRLLQSLIEIDEAWTQWRYRHALMAQRMIGTKIGTGGSSGSDYLQRATEQHKVFQDFTKLSTFFIPRAALPKLPDGLSKHLSFVYAQ
jgi:tryptophan 2,3-dioxygenase